MKKLNPLNIDQNIVRTTAPWTLDEFFHNYIKSKKREIRNNNLFPFFDHSDILKKTESVTRTKEFLALFKQESIDTRELNDVFFDLFLHARNNDILSLKPRDKKIHSKDLLHLSYALNTRCNMIITCDGGFSLLKEIREIKDMISFFKLKRILILDGHIKKINEKIDFSP